MKMRWNLPWKSLSGCPEQAEEQDNENNQGDHHVHAVALKQKAYGGKSYAGNWRKHEQQQSELDDPAAMQRQSLVGYAADTFQVLLFPVKRVVLGMLKPMIEQIYSTSGENHDCSKHYSGAKQIADNLFELEISPASQFLHLHSRPVSALKIISTAMIAMTPLNTIRRILVCIRTSALAPNMDPSSTPNITGMARPGLM
jgi:hypothetical protein